ncbi:melanopsin-like [Montipora foliosa]|uniref:melanopsin-like n=1 Tax=Montipora foliosa TaxID=591990 RepID=UPI0035F18D3B
MSSSTIDTFSAVIAVTVFTLSASFTSFTAATLFYAFYRERKLRVSSAIPVLNLCVSGFLLAAVSGLCQLLHDVLQVNIYESSHLLDVKCFVEHFSISIYFQALFFISAIRYGLAMCGDNLFRASKKQTTICIGITWVLSLIYAGLVTFYQLQGRSRPGSFPRGVAAAQFSFLGFLHFGTISIYANLVLYFHQRKDNIPPDFYSLESSCRRIAERNIQVSVKNIQMIAVTVGTLCACHLPHLFVIAVAMFTGQLSPNAKVFCCVTMQCGVFINLILHGYLNKRFKRIVRPMLHRWIHRITNKRGRCRRINEFLPQHNISTSRTKITFNSSENSLYELTRSKLVHLYR